MSKKVPRELIQSQDFFPLSCFPSPEPLLLTVLVFLSKQQAISPFPSLSFERHPVNRDCHNPETETVVFTHIASQQCDNPSNFHDSLSKKILFAPLWFWYKTQSAAVKFFPPKAACDNWPLIIFLIKNPIHT